MAPGKLVLEMVKKRSKAKTRKTTKKCKNDNNDDNSTSLQDNNTNTQYSN